MTWEYNMNTNTIWTSFDYGEVEADTFEEAYKLALKELTYNFNKANEVLKTADVTISFTVEFADDQIDVKQKKQ